MSEELWYVPGVGNVNPSTVKWVVVRCKSHFGESSDWYAPMSNCVTNDHEVVSGEMSYLDACRTAEEFNSAIEVMGA